MRRKWHKSHAFCSNFPHPREPNTRLNDNLFGEGWEMSAPNLLRLLLRLSPGTCGHMWTHDRLIPRKSGHKWSLVTLTSSLENRCSIQLSYGSLEGVIHIPSRLPMQPDSLDSTHSNPDC